MSVGFCFERLGQRSWRSKVFLRPELFQNFLICMIRFIMFESKVNYSCFRMLKRISVANLLNYYLIYKSRNTIN